MKRDINGKPRDQKGKDQLRKNAKEKPPKASAKAGRDRKKT
jgi:hypothetical protein